MPRQYEAGFQPAIPIAADEPRALPWADMNQSFGLTFLLLLVLVLVLVIVLEQSSPNHHHLMVEHSLNLKLSPPTSS